jgi:hypothetical protein
VIWIDAEVDPAEFKADTVYDALAATAVGVPEMTPVVAPRLKPCGSSGLTE